MGFRVFFIPVIFSLLILTSGTFLRDLHSKSLPSQGQPANQAVRHCSMGEASAVLQGLENALIHWNIFEGEESKDGLGAWYDCQYRLWATEDLVNGGPWTFCTEDHFLGGTASVVGYDPPFCSQSFSDCKKDADCPEAGEFCVSSLSEVDTLFKEDEFIVTVMFGPDEGALVEQEMFRTPTKNAHDPADGNFAWFQVGFITQQEPGIYRSELQEYINGVPSFYETVLIEVVSHQEHLNRVNNGTWN